MRRINAVPHAAPNLASSLREITRFAAPIVISLKHRARYTPWQEVSARSRLPLDTTDPRSDSKLYEDEEGTQNEEGL